MSDMRIDELDKIEWFDVCRALKPGLSEEEYDVTVGRLSILQGSPHEIENIIVDVRKTRRLKRRIATVRA